MISSGRTLNTHHTQPQGNTGVREPLSGHKRLSDDSDTSDATNASATSNKRQCTLSDGPWMDGLPQEVFCLIAAFLPTFVDLEDQSAKVVLRRNIVALAKLPTVQRKWWGWRVQLRALMDEACSRFAYVYVKSKRDADSTGLDEDTVAAPPQKLPLAFAAMEVHRVARDVPILLRDLLLPNGFGLDFRFNNVAVVRGFLMAALQMKDSKDVCEQDETSLRRLPLTVLAMAYQRSLSTQTSRFDDIVGLLMDRWGQFPPRIQVLLKFDLEAIYPNDTERLRLIEKAWTDATTARTQRAACRRAQQIDGLNGPYELDQKGARLEGLKNTLKPPSGCPRSPSYILTLSWIAHHWAELPSLDELQSARQRELEDEVVALFEEVARSISETAQRSHADVVLQAFPAELRHTALQRLDRHYRAKLLVGLPPEIDPSAAATHKST